MKSLCLTCAVVLAFFALTASGASAFLRVENGVGDYWIYRFAGKTINLRHNIEHKMQKESDREVKVEDVNLTFGGRPLSEVVARYEAGPLATLRLYCKEAAGACVYSHFSSETYTYLDILCKNEQDCITFVQALPQ